MRRTKRAGEFEDFARAETAKLFSLACAMTGNRHDAWDLVQESLVRMAERWDRSSFETPEAYVRTVMARLNVDRFRRLKREVLHSRPLGETYPAPPAHDTPLGGWLADALADLSPNQRTAVALRFVEDLSVREIAERMGCSEGTVKSQLSRGIGRLRSQLPTNFEIEETSR